MRERARACGAARAMGTASRMRSACAETLRDALRRSAETGTLDEALGTLSPREIAFLARDWLIWARDDQLPPVCTPEGRPWRTWLVLGGRGAGKTRAGAEWVRAQALGLAPLARAPARRIALVGQTLGDVRDVMVEGVSGLLAIHGDAERPRFEPSKRRLAWPNGAEARMFSAEDPESLRGPQFAAAWCDELCKWRHGEETWDMLQFALRLGDAPRQVVTTTPRPIPLLTRIMADPGSVVTRARTRDNAANLAPGFLDEITRRYGGTWLGRQELDGEILEDRPDALWRRCWIEEARVRAAPHALARVVVGVDPPVTSGSGADACGIVIAGRAEDGRAFVLADRTVQGARPLDWARAVASAYHDFEADRVVAEVNQGGELVAAVLRQVDGALPIRMVRASRGKWVRAEPVAALYAQGRVCHVGALPELEDQLCDFGPGGLSGGGSPDRLDALVWALSDLMLAPHGRPTVRSL